VLDFTDFRANMPNGRSLEGPEGGAMSGPFDTEGPGTDPYPDPPVTPGDVGSSGWGSADPDDD
jgi:hypothetical protein